MSILALLASGQPTPVDPPPVYTEQGLYGPGLLHPGITAERVSPNPTTNETSSMPEDIIKVGDTYWMTSSYWPAATGHTQIHIASSASPEGPWAPYAGNPILTSGGAGSGQSPYTNACSLLEHEGTFYLFYASDTSNLTSTDGHIWVATAPAVTGPYTKHPDVLLSPVPDSWESRRVQEPHVIIAPDGTWVMTYMAEPTTVPKHKGEKVGIATAPGPFGPWTRSPNNPVVGFGEPGAWDSACIADSSLFYDDGTWWMLYSAFNDYTSGGHPWGIGLVYADDIHGPWTRIPTNPILSGSGVSGTFDRQSVWRGALYHENGVYHFAYAGLDDSVSTAKGGNARIVL